MFAVLPVMALAWAAIGSESRAAGVLMLSDRFDGSSERFRSQLSRSVAEAGIALQEIEGVGLAAALRAAVRPGTILLLSDARCFPADAKQELDAFLKRGNHLLAVSGPPLGKLVVRSGNEWLTREQAKAGLARAHGEPIIDFAAEDLTRWRRISGAQDNPAAFRAVESGSPEVPHALDVSISRLDNWDTIVSPPLDTPFPQGHNVTTLWAKGGPDTPELVIEWREKDGCRWMAVIGLTTRWARYALTPDDFRYWSDNPALGRGKPGDRFNPANAEVISFAVASGISSQKLGIAHSYQVSDVRAVKDPFADVDFSPPILESLSPTYKTYGTFADAVEPAAGGERTAAGTQVVCALPRSPGFGSNALRNQRYITVLRALGKSGEPRGAAAHILLNSGGEYAGSVWGYIGFRQDFLEDAPERAAEPAALMLRRMTQGVFLANAGSEHFAYSSGEQVELGAFALNLSDRPVDAEVEFSIVSPGGSLISSRSSAVLPAGGAPVRVAGGKWTPEPGVYAAKTVLLVDGAGVDEITHEFRVTEYGEADPSEVVQVKDGHFYLGGEKWHALGMNYWPRYSTGLESPDWSRWASPEQYNPEIVEQDLALAKKLGLNTLSVQYMRADQARAMMDFAERCRAHGIKLHVFIPGLHPLDQNFASARALIEAAHLPQSPAMFAYDVGWEVHVGRYEQRRAYDRNWHDWVVDQYGSIEAAERAWGYSPAREDGVITGPADDQLMTDGEWRVFVAAYRRFWDDEISKRYREVREFIRSLDRHRLVCARSGYGGTGAKWVADRFPFDLASGAKHLDFTSPEAYGIAGDRANFIHGGFTTEYGRFVSGGKPVFWAEYGMSVWPQCDEATLERQRELYEDTLRMMRESYANGSAGWWWPGGFRVGENSDYGVVNPDATPRPAALEIAAFSAGFTPADVPRRDILVTIDRDDHVTGYAGVYAAARDEYVKAVESGLFPGLRTAGTGTTSATVPLVAVGNVPAGAGPPKFLNAEFNWIRINGMEAKNEDRIEVQRGAPVSVEASVGNTQEALWLAPGNDGGQGTVWLKARPAGSPENFILAPIAADTGFLSDALVVETQLLPALDRQTEFVFRMTALGRADFGEVRRVVLVPR